MVKPMQREIIHERFLEYYEKLGFQLSYRAPMLHPSVPMSFVMSAGLVQIELGLTQLGVNGAAPPPPAILIQTCFRHFDIHKIGERNSHLSLFEMPGAFIFGAENRLRLLRWQWQFVTQELAIPRERIWATYFIGGQLGAHDLPPDLDSRNTWLALGLPPERVIGYGMDGNYWQQGGSVAEDPTRRRKCGPQTELFYDRGEALRCGADCAPGCGCGRFVEFSNTLFISHEYDSIRGALIPLVLPFSETVIGTERVAMILQEAPSVFDTSEFLPLMEAVRTRFAPHHAPGDGQTHLRVIADHLRSIYVLLSEGAPPPGKNGRARIIRVLMRNIITRMILLGSEDGGGIDNLLAHVRAHVSHLVIDADGTEAKFREYFAQELVRFTTTVRQGEQELCKLVDGNEGSTLTGTQIAFLEKKLGLPVLLIRKQLDEMKLLFDEEGYQTALKETPPSSSVPTKATASVNEGEAAMVMETVKSQLTQFLREAVEELGADLATLYLYDPNWDQLYYPVGVNLSDQYIREFERSVPDMDRVPGRLVTSKQPIFETDVLRGSLAGPFSIRENVRSAAALPLFDAQGNVRGTVFFNYRRARSFPDSERDAIIATAGKLAQAVDEEISKHQGFSLDTEAVAAHMLEQRELAIIEETLDAADAAIRDAHLIFMLPDDALTMLSSTPSPKIDPMLASFSLPLDQSNFIVDAFHELTERQMYDVRQAGIPAVAERADHLRWLTGFAIPLSAGRSSIGVLCAFTIDHSGFTDTEQELLRNYARQVALRIDSERRIDSMTALNGLATRLARVSDIDTAVRALASASLRILRADMVSIDVYDPAKLAFTKAYTHDTHTEALDLEDYAGELRKPTPVQENILEHGAVITINDMENADDDLIDSNIIRKYGIQSFTAMPLRYRDVKLGAIYVNSRSPNAFISEEIRQIKNVVTFASNALYTVWINQKRDQARDLMEDLAQQTKNANLEGLIDHLLEEVAALFDCEVSSLGFFDRRSSDIEFRYAYGARTGDRQSKTVGLVGEALRTKKPVKTGDARTDPRYNPFNPETQSEMDIPLIVEDRVIAILNLESKRRRAFNDDLLGLAETVSGQIAPILYTLELRERERVLEEFGGEIRRGVNLAEEEIFQRVALLAQRLQLDTKDFYMGLYDDFTKEFRYVNVIKNGQRVNVGQIHDPHRSVELQDWRPRRDGKRRADWVALVGKPLCHLTRDEGLDWYRKHMRGEIPSEVSHSWIGVPINSGERESSPDSVKVRGVIVLQDNENDDAFAESDEHVLQLLANLVGIALYNSRLYSDLAPRYRTL
ncbi:MAG: GAF domain-containing protein, partial [Anaerolinea sp.]|nr:GAF domain-containing protein [Anaerolinea sp.]